MFAIFLFVSISYSFRLNLTPNVYFNRNAHSFSIARTSSFSFLNSRDQQNYLSSILKSSVENTKKAMSDNNLRIEIAFPENRKSDISVGESLEINRNFVREFSNSFQNLGKDLWIVFPDRKESFLALKLWGSFSPFTTVSIETLSMTQTTSPKLLLIVNPGFNVEEWISIAKAPSIENVPIIIINGNLDRLRNGYYPSFFYPELKRVSDKFYKQFSPVYYLNPISVGGDRYGAWLMKLYKQPWQIVVKGKDGYEQIGLYDEEPDPKVAWNTAKSKFQSIWGGLF